MQQSVTSGKIPGGPKGSPILGVMFEFPRDRRGFLTKVTQPIICNKLPALNQSGGAKIEVVSGLMLRPSQLPVKAIPIQ